MKKIILYVLFFVIVVFSMPVILTKKDFVKSVVANEITNNAENIEYDAPSIDNEKNSLDDDNSASYKKYNYSQYGIIKLLHSEKNEVEELSIDDYLLGVVSAEMPADYEIEALKAQAIVARTYTAYMIKNNSTKHDGADICDDSTCCQAWISKEDRMSKWDENKKDSNWKKIEEAVYSTAGMAITYDNEIIDAFFHSNSGGKTENVSNVWGGSDLPYLQSVETSGEDEYSQYSSEVILSKMDFENKIKEKHSDFTINYSDTDSIKITEYTSGNRVKTIKIGNLNLSGVEVRTLIGLKSANFEVNISENDIKFTVIGYRPWRRNESNWS